MSEMPTFFLSHGSPTVVIDDSEPSRFLRTLSEYTPKPKAIVIVSAHFETPGPVVVTDPEPEMIYDFGGFPEELYRMVYPAPGSPGLAGHVAHMLMDAGLEPRIAKRRGFDHGTWTPLKLAWPEANIPIVQLSIDPNRDAEYHYRLGRALSELRKEGILLIGSGHITHNLRVAFGILRHGEAPDPVMAKKVGAFTKWIADRLESDNAESVLTWREDAPYVAENHPTDEHLLPIFFALGAAGEGARGELIHSSSLGGVFTSDFYRFR